MLLSTQEILEVIATRYLAAAGLVILIYDHFLTLPEEINFIWKGSYSPRKLVYILNRYGAPPTMMALAYEMCGFSYAYKKLSLSECRILILIPTVLGVVFMAASLSTAITCVISLWEYNKPIIWSLLIGFLLTFGTALALIVLGIWQTWDTVQFSPQIDTCTFTKAPSVLIGVWASILVFDLFVLGCAILNALSRPRRAETLLVKALHSDCISFFMLYAIFRVSNLVAAATQNPGLAFMTIYFVCPMEIVLSSRLMFRVAHLERLQMVDYYDLQDDIVLEEYRFSQTSLCSD